MPYSDPTKERDCQHGSYLRRKARQHGFDRLREAAALVVADRDARSIERLAKALRDTQVVKGPMVKAGAVAAPSTQEAPIE